MIKVHRVTRLHFFVVVVGDDDDDDDRDEQQRQQPQPLQPGDDGGVGLKCALNWWSQQCHL